MFERCLDILSVVDPVDTMSYQQYMKIATQMLAGVPLSSYRGGVLRFLSTIVKRYGYTEELLRLLASLGTEYVMQDWKFVLECLTRILGLLP